MVKRYRIVMSLGVGALVISALFAIGIGHFSIGQEEILRAFLQKPTAANASIILWNVRMPRIVMSIIAGSGLAAAG